MPDPATRSRVCAQRSSSAAVDLVSGLARFQSQLAITAPARMPTTKTAITVGPQPGALLAEARLQNHQKDAKIKAERRVGSLGGMRQEPTRVQTGRGELTKPARNFSTLLSLFSIHWRPVFPPGPLPETSRGLRCCQNLVVITKVADAVERGVRKRGFEVRSSALTISLQRNQPLCCTRCNQTQRARGQA